MKLSQMRYFQAVCHYKNITRAAKELHISQPSLSNVIRELEDEFDVGLFERLSKGVVLTPQGVFFLAHVEEVLQKTDWLEAQMHSLSKTAMKLNVGVPPMIGSTLFPKLYQDFRAAFPEIILTVHEYGTPAILKMLGDGALDGAIISSEQKDSPDFGCVNLCEVKTFFCVAQTHPLAHRKLIGIQDIGRAPIVLLGDTSFQAVKIRKQFKQHHLEPNILLQTNQIHAVKKFIRHQGACSFLYEGIIEADDQIVSIPLEEGFIVQINVIWKKTNHATKATRKIYSYLRKYRF